MFYHFTMMVSFFIDNRSNIEITCDSDSIKERFEREMSKAQIQIDQLSEAWGRIDDLERRAVERFIDVNTVQ